MKVRIIEFEGNVADSSVLSDLLAGSQPAVEPEAPARAVVVSEIRLPVKKLPSGKPATNGVVKPAAAEVNGHSGPTTSDLIRECLKTGPKLKEAIVDYCRAHGKPASDPTQIHNLLYQLSRRGQVSQDETTKKWQMA